MYQSLLRRKSVSTLDCGVNTFNTFDAESYTSSTMSWKEDGFAEKQYFQIRGCTLISQRFRAEVLKSFTVLVRFGRRHRLCRNYLNAYCGSSLEHRPGTAIRRECQFCNEVVFLGFSCVRMRYVSVSIVRSAHVGRMLIFNRKVV